MSRVLVATDRCDLVYVDPDNGVRRTDHVVPSHRNKSEKHAYFDELRQFAVRGQSVVAYHHADRSTTVDRQAQLRLLDAAEQLSIEPLAAVRPQSFDHEGQRADSEGIAISVSCARSEQAPLELIDNLLKAVISRPPPAGELVEFVTARRLPKFHERLPLELQRAETQADALDVAGAVQLAAKILSVTRPGY